MAEKLVTEHPLGDACQDTLREGITARRVFDVLAASAIDARLVLARERKIKIGALYRNAKGEAPDPFARCLGLDIRAKTPAPLGKTGLYEVAVSYGRHSPNDVKPEVGGPPVYRWTRAEQSVPMEVDRNGDRVANTAGEPVTPPPSKLLVGRNLQVEWYAASEDYGGLFTYDGAVNSTVWNLKGRWPFPAGSALCHGIDPFEEAEGQVLLTGHFEFRPRLELWEPVKVSNHTWRDGKRLVLDADGDVAESDGDKVHFRDFSGFHGKDFNALGI